MAATWDRPGLPVPQVLEVGEAFDGVYAVSERVHGHRLEELDARGWHGVLPGVLDALAAMRSVSLPGAGFGRWRSDGSGPSSSWRESLLAVADDEGGGRLRGWRRRLAASHGAVEEFDRWMGALAEAAAAVPELRQLVHGDLTAGNVLVEDGRITGIFDWANSLAGDPLYDVGWLSFWSPWHPGLDAIDIRAAARARFADADFDARVRCYQLHVGLDDMRWCGWTRLWPQLEDVMRRLRTLVDEA